MSKKDLKFRKSSFSGDAGQCVEVAVDGSRIFVRDSKNPAGGALTFTNEEWKAFLQGAKAGEFDISKRAD